MKKSQLFKIIPENIILFNFLNKICNINYCNNPENIENNENSENSENVENIENSKNSEKYYILSKTIFKKAEFNHLINNFISDLKTHYHTSKHYYLERKLTYMNFMTIIRQLCNVNDIKYKTKLIYNNSRYEIEYYIYCKVD
jgi:hypothetical protein